MGFCFKNRASGSERTRIVHLFDTGRDDNMAPQLHFISNEMVSNKQTKGKTKFILNTGRNRK